MGIEDVSYSWLAAYISLPPSTEAELRQVEDASRGLLVRLGMYDLTDRCRHFNWQTMLLLNDIYQQSMRQAYTDAPPSTRAVAALRLEGESESLIRTALDRLGNFYALSPESRRLCQEHNRRVVMQHLSLRQALILLQVDPYIETPPEHVLAVTGSKLEALV